MKFITPNLIFLDNNHDLAAQYLTNKHLDKQIRNCCQILMCYLYYQYGIRNKRIFDYYFHKDRMKDMLERFFKTYPLDSKPTFMKYNSPESRWIRKCKNHYDYVLSYLRSLLTEYLFRFQKQHELNDMVSFFNYVLYQNSIRYGLQLNYINGLKIILPWKNLPLKYRKKNIIEGYRLYYQSTLIDPIMDYIGSKRSTPEFMVNGVFDFV